MIFTIPLIRQQVDQHRIQIRLSVSNSFLKWYGYPWFDLFQARHEHYLVFLHWLVCPINQIESWWHFRLIVFEYVLSSNQLQSHFPDLLEWSNSSESTYLLYLFSYHISKLHGRANMIIVRRLHISCILLCLLAYGYCFSFLHPKCLLHHVLYKVYLFVIFWLIEYLHLCPQKPNKIIRCYHIHSSYLDIHHFSNSLIVQCKNTFENDYIGTINGCCLFFSCMSGKVINRHSHWFSIYTNQSLYFSVQLPFFQFLQSIKQQVIIKGRWMIKIETTIKIGSVDQLTFFFFFLLSYLWWANLLCSGVRML